MFIQKMDWGFIEYYDAPGHWNQASMTAGITTLYAGKHFPSHVHYGHEQMVYVIEGEGVYIINGEVRPCSQGMFFYMPSETVHETFNTGNGIMRELFIGAPCRYDLEFSSIKTMAACAQRDMLAAAIEVLKLPLFEQTAVPFTVMDANWQVVFQNGNFLPFCMTRCRPTVKAPACSCLCARSLEDVYSEDPLEFTCPHGLTAYFIPILNNGRFVAALIGGHFLASGNECCAEGLFAQPESTVMSIQKWLARIAHSIRSFCDFYSMYKSLSDKDLQFRQAKQTNTLLQKDLSLTQNIVTNLRIDYHFLFNTLNTIAGMTIENKREDIFTAIVDLSKMMRYTMNNTRQAVPLREELEQLGLYLKLQKLRFGERLNVRLDIAEGLGERSVPFNFLQPIVENAFVHGGITRGEKTGEIRICAAFEGGGMRIDVYNNGMPLDEAAKLRIREGYKQNSGHGLSLIYTKLTERYGSRFAFHIDNMEDGVCVHIVIPQDLDCEGYAHD